jgi:hypothetical protein
MKIFGIVKRGIEAIFAVVAVSHVSQFCC